MSKDSLIYKVNGLFKEIDAFTGENKSSKKTTPTTNEYIIDSQILKHINGRSKTKEMARRNYEDCDIVRRRNLGVSQTVNAGNSDNNTEDTDKKNKEMQAVISQLETLQKACPVFNENNKISKIVSNGIINKDEALSIKKTIERAMGNVFLIYGRNEKLNRKIKSAIENAGFNVLSLNKQCVKGGESLLQAVKRQAKKCTMAVAVCSADDQVVFKGELYRQARPNVYFEIGYLYGLYGEYRVLIVKQEECRNPSDLAVMYIQENNLAQLTNSLLEISEL